LPISLLLINVVLLAALLAGCSGSDTGGSGGRPYSKDVVKKAKRLVDQKRYTDAWNVCAEYNRSWLGKGQNPSKAELADGLECSMLGIAGLYVGGRKSEAREKVRRVCNAVNTTSAKETLVAYIGIKVGTILIKIERLPRTKATQQLGGAIRDLSNACYISYDRTINKALQMLKK
jgi:hypothetical protein